MMFLFYITVVDQGPEGIKILFTSCFQ